MDRRLELDELLVNILGSENVYFQPPETVKMTYPCIVYKLAAIDARFADNRPYSLQKRYTAVVIDPDPDSEIPSRMALLPLCKLDRPYTAENLNHYVFNIYY